jgi:tripartite-type tricarboxylate transporter receptor subunit TctC
VRTERQGKDRFLVAVALGICTIIAAPGVIAQDFPTRPLRMIVPWAPAGAADILARTLSQKMAEHWNQQVVVDNRPGANGVIGTELAARAPADGYTLLMGATGPNSVLPSLVAKLPYDALKDFAPVSLVATTTYVLSVNPSLPVNSVKDLIAYAKSKPGQLTFGSPGAGTPNHLSGEMFKAATGIDMQHVPYKGSAPVITDIMGGQITLAFENIAPVLPHIKSGRLKALAISASKRSALLPDIPTVAESGFPGFQAVGWFGVLAPAGTPHDAIARLNAETVRVLKLADVRERLSGLGAEIIGSTVEDFATFEKSEIEKWAKVVKSANVHIE